VTRFIVILLVEGTGRGPARTTLERGNRAGGHRAAAAFRINRKAAARREPGPSGWTSELVGRADLGEAADVRVDRLVVTGIKKKKIS
jgi:hypothetical protein